MQYAPVFTALFEFSQGRTLFGDLGEFQLWCPGTEEACTSQTFFDPYSLTHLEHGLLMHAAGLSFGTSVALESFWEAVENSEWGIQHYRQQGYAKYRGDSVLNSMSDILCTGVGWWMGTGLSPVQSVLLAGSFDFFLQMKYGDSLSKNILSLLGIK